ncbi:hypothetical protein Moror_7620, partial [Moniliophthora roreri MCA 2997]
MLASGPSRGLGRLEYEEKSIYWFWNPVDSITWERQPMLEGKARSYIRPDSEPTCTTNLQVTRNILTMGNSSLYRMLHEVQALGAKSETLFGISNCLRHERRPEAVVLRALAMSVMVRLGCWDAFEHLCSS